MTNGSALGAFALDAAKYGRMVRVAGGLYLIIILCAGFSEGVVRAGVMVPGDASATATNLVASQTLFRAGFLTDLTAFVADVALAAVLFVLMAHAGTALSLTAAAFRMTQAAILGLNMLNHFEPLLALQRPVSQAIDPVQLQALIYLSLQRHEYGYLIGQTFFSAHCVILGALLWRSPRFPNYLGAFIVAAGLGYAADAVTHFLVPDLATGASPFFLAPVIVAELTLCVWLLVYPRRSRVS